MRLSSLLVQWHSFTSCFNKHSDFAAKRLVVINTMALRIITELMYRIWRGFYVQYPRVELREDFMHRYKILLFSPQMSMQFQNDSIFK